MRNEYLKHRRAQQRARKINKIGEKTMNEIKLGSNIEEYSINGGKVILRFNPFDSGFVEKFNTAFVKEKVM